MDPEKHFALEPGHIGEIWVAGGSKCLGYWNNPELALKMFHARLVDDSPYDDGYLRTGDMGFIHEGELFVCGRIKDMIIVRGQNYYPQDIEEVVEKASGLIRTNCVAAFQIHEDSEPALAVIAEVKEFESASGSAEDCRRCAELSERGSGADFFHSAPCDSENQFGQDHAPQNQADVAGRSIYGSLGVFAGKKRGTRNARFSPFDVLKARYNLTGTESVQPGRSRAGFPGSCCRSCTRSRTC